MAFFFLRKSIKQSKSIWYAVASGDGEAAELSRRWEQGQLFTSACDGPGVKLILEFEKVATSMIVGDNCADGNRNRNRARLILWWGMMYLVTYGRCT